MSNFLVPTKDWLGFHLFLKEKHPDLSAITPEEEMKLLWNAYVYEQQRAITEES